jgi:PmbA protein
MSGGRELVLRALERLRHAGADEGDALLVESDASEVRVRGDEIDFVKESRERTLGIRALVAGAKGLRSAHASTSDLAPESVERMVDATVALARATAPDPAAGLPEGGFAEDDPDLSLADPGDRGAAVEDRIASARRAEAAARALDPRIVNSEGSQAAAEFSRIVYGNTRGFLGAYETASHALSCEPVARENGTLQRDSWWTTAHRLGDLEPPEQVGRRAAGRALRRLGARRVRTQEVPVLFDPVTAPSLLGHVAACANGYAVYRETSFLAPRMGQRIASELVTLVDDGRLPGGLGSRPFDGEGLPTRRTPILRRGCLESWLLDAYSARKLGLAPTGNAARAPASAPAAAPTNLWLEPGTGTLEDLVASTERGLLVTELFGMGFQPATGDYSRGAWGLWIEGGEIVHPVQEVTIAGNLGEMLLAIDAVAADLVWLGRVASPSLRIARMTVAGD